METLPSKNSSELAFSAEVAERLREMFEGKVCQICGQPAQRLRSNSIYLCFQCFARRKVKTDRTVYAKQRQPKIYSFWELPAPEHEGGEPVIFDEPEEMYIDEAEPAEYPDWMADPWFSQAAHKYSPHRLRVNNKVFPWFVLNSVSWNAFKNK